MLTCLSPSKMLETTDTQWTCVTLIWIKLKVRNAYTNINGGHGTDEK